MTLYPANLLNSFVKFILYNYIFCKLYNFIALSLILIYFISFPSLTAFTWTSYIRLNRSGVITLNSYLTTE